MTNMKKSERWTDEEVSALLDIYAEDTTQGMLLKPVPNSKIFDRCSKLLLEMEIVHSALACRLKIKKLRQDYKKTKDWNNKSGNDRRTTKWFDRLDALLGSRPSFTGTASSLDSGSMASEAAPTANLEGDNDEGEENQQHSVLETSEVLGVGDQSLLACSSPLPATKRKGKRTQDALFLETVQALEDQRAVANESLRVDQMVQFSQTQEAEARMITSMERQSELALQQMERQRHQDEVLALRQELRQERQDEQQAAFNTGFLEVLSQLVKANRSSSK
ncbi:uncharacterized protein LOC117475199 isoform X2 [Trematomus bernacchii]|uniref:uncharacterized protein LOC117475199 isoform X1 n=1 Tax=Trematomus bernacchii TaxID=40690 RepID=UPI00146AC6A8|nr:uncharacterized protein LOC117475199 isoform X1 [Trematomus bernacchii]XP_033977251.1 uncharacterized protein LOC117475199 isoform X2 [Trematomus bernacchii]